MAASNNRTVFAVALLLFLGGLGYLVFSGVSSDSVYFLNVSEALSMEPDKLDQARLFGTVAAEGIEPGKDALGVAFNLADKMHPGSSLRVQYRGAVPDTFKAGAEVIVEGRFSKPGQVFDATTLITKCPSKYKKMSDEQKG